MKFTRFLIAFLIAVPLVYSCQADIEDLADPRDAITRRYEVTETQEGGFSGYWVTLSKDANDKTRVLFDGNFHQLDSQDNLYAVFATPILTIPSQTIDGTYTIAGSGTVKNEGETIEFTYTVFDGDVTETITASYGPVIVSKKKAKAKKELQ